MQHAATGTDRPVVGGPPPAAGIAATVFAALDTLQRRDSSAWQHIDRMASTSWTDADALIVALFIRTMFNEWPHGPSPAQSTALVRFLEERFDGIVDIYEHTGVAIMQAAARRKYDEIASFPLDVQMVFMLTAIATITLRRDYTGQKLSDFVVGVYAATQGR